MRVPLRLNRSGWRAPQLPRRVCLPDPRDLLEPAHIATPEAFADHISVFRTGEANKTTRPGRHRQSDAMVLRALGAARPTVLDVGASDGSTSLDLLAALGDRFSAYYVTDRYLSLRAHLDADGRAFFYEDTGACILIATPRWVLYPSHGAAPAWLRPVLSLLRREIPPFREGYPEVSLIQPRLRALAARDPRVVVRRHDIFQRWDGSQVTLVKVANLLNRAYFPDLRIRAAVRNLWHALSPGGLLLVIDNREVEKGSLFSREEDGFRLVDRVGGGTEIADLVQSTRADLA